MKGEAGGTANADQKGDGQANGGQGIGYIGGGISQIPYTLADKDLIYNIVRELTSIAVMLGTANFFSKVDIFS